MITRFLPIPFLGASIFVLPMMPFLLPSVSAQVGKEGDYFAWRTWVISGKQVQAQLEGWVNDRASASLRAAGGVRIEVAWDDLGAVDQHFVSKAMGAADENMLKREPLPVSSPLLKAEVFPDRTAIPAINHRDFGQKSGDSFIAAFTNFVLWWDRENFLPIARRGDFERKAESVQTWLTRDSGTRNTVGTRSREARQGFGTYFDEHLADVATFNSRVDYDLSPENLSRYTTGMNATLLTLGFKKGRDIHRQTVSLATADAGGEIIINYGGIVAKGRMVPLSKTDQMVEVPGTGTRWRQGKAIQINGTTYTVKFTEEPDFPYFKGSEIIIDPSLGHQLIVFKPYLYAQPGKKCRPPDDPLFPLQ